MSENFPAPSTSGCSNSGAPTSSIYQRRCKPLIETLKLPTPPPDPNETRETGDDFLKGGEFLEYLESLRKHHADDAKSTSTAAAIITDDAFDHLEKLYKLMEQMLELRAQNAKLHRKIRDLEHLNKLEKMYKHVETTEVDEPCPELDKDTFFAETILESILNQPNLYISKPAASNRQSILRKPRLRGSSLSDKSDLERKPIYSSEGKHSKISKWTKVKAAFKWEKASTSVGDSKSMDSGIGGMVPVNVEVARYLRVPSTSDDPAHSPSADSGAAEISTPGTISTASSNEDFQNSGQRSPCEDFRSSDDDHCFHYSTSIHSKEDPNYKPNSSQKSGRSTPWAKMKEIIHTRSSIKKKNRLSSHSDDIQIDVELCSDTEDVFENTKLSESKTHPYEISAESIKNNVPLEIVTRYQEATDDENKPKSKWTRVKKAFLPTLDANEAEINLHQRENKYIQLEINRNYRHLQKKLGLEFQKKLSEYNVKKHLGINVLPSPNAENSCDADFLKKINEWDKIKSQGSIKQKPPTLTIKENLSPKFRKKLQQWEKIKKNCHGEHPTRKSASEMMEEHHQAHSFEYPVITDDFKKKLEEWKEIKAKRQTSRTESDDSSKKYTKTPSPSSPRKFLPEDNSAMKGELVWFEKELSNIDKEKQRLEKERQKFFEREERLTKLGKSITGGNKKDILVHTPCGFYRFEGISRKFTQKLYEWEKSQGIRPESSTFAFLTPSCLPKLNLSSHAVRTPRLARSKSADSLISVANNEFTLKSNASSLSLNDINGLGKECLTQSKSSLQYLFEHFNETETSEPEAMIVEVEDYVEETASPLRKLFKQHKPVYQMEGIKALCESETCLGPKVRRSESSRAQSNYILIENIFEYLNGISENEFSIRTLCKSNQGNTLNELKDLNEKQINLSCKLHNKLIKLKEENFMVISTVTGEAENFENSVISSTLDVIHDLSSEMILLAEKFGIELRMREGNIERNQEFQIVEIIDEIKGKLLEVRRQLSYICAESDLTVPWKKKSNRFSVSLRDVKVEEPKALKSIEHFEKNYSHEVSNENTSGGAIKKRLRYRLRQSRTYDDTDEDENEIENREQKRKQRRFSKSRSTSGNSTSFDNFQKQITEPVQIPNFTFSMENYKSQLSASEKSASPDSPVTIFVKTTRKLFTPLVALDVGHKNTEGKIEEESEIGTRPIEIKIEPVPPTNEVMAKKEKLETVHFNDLQTPPISPIPQRKQLRDMSPNIRLMLSKYTQKVSEQDTPYKPHGSGSGSPTIWRSPTMERKVKVQAEKYQKDIKKLTLSFPRKIEIQKSTSVEFFRRDIKNGNADVAECPDSEISDKLFKSTSFAAISEKSMKQNLMESNMSKMKHSSELRMLKLKKAKEDFLNCGPLSAPILRRNECPKFAAENRLSQISVQSEQDDSSCAALIKSKSSGMINIDSESYQRLQPEIHQQGYVSLPRDTQKISSSKLSLNSITAKFRKVRMKKGKDRDRPSAVSVLCRQSLMVDITPSLAEDLNLSHSRYDQAGSSCHSPSTSKMPNWIKKAKLFKK